MVIAVLGAALAAVGNAGVTWQTGRNQIRLEAENNHNNRELETLKAEAARILESIKTNNVDQAAINLKFLIDAGLVRQPETVSYIQRYLDKRSPGQSGPVLPSPTVNLRDFESDDTRTRRQARETAAAEGSLIVPDLAKLLAANREKANYNYRQVLGAIVALGNMDQNTRCTEYAKNPELRQDVERWQQFKDLTMRHAAANALACSP